GRGLAVEQDKAKRRGTLRLLGASYQVGRLELALGPGGPAPGEPGNARGGVDECPVLSAASLAASPDIGRIPSAIEGPHGVIGQLAKYFSDSAVGSARDLAASTRFPRKVNAHATTANERCE